jgi:hypothetical protein
MTVRKWLLIVASAILITFAGLAVAERFAVDWLPTAVSLALPLAAGAIAMTIKTRRERKTRSTAPDSVEAAADEKSRAGAFHDAIYATLVAVAISAFADELTAVIICMSLLAVFMGSYWLRRALSTLPTSHADHQ